MGAVVISRQPGDDPDRAEVERKTREAVSEANVELAVIPHLYYIYRSSEIVDLLCTLTGPLAVASWMHPRPARWTLHRLGVDLRQQVSCFCLADYCCGGRAAEALLDFLPNTPGSGNRGKLREVDAAVSERWYPVVDYDRCTGCRQCLEFCLFGVYDAEDDRVTVAEPDNCKPGCPACARVCPEGAIMFPHYEDDPGIAGAPDAEVGGGDIEAAESLRSRSVDSVPDEEASADGECCSGDDDGLDDLIGELDDMDDS